MFDKTILELKERIENAEIHQKRRAIRFVEIDRRAKG